MKPILKKIVVSLFLLLLWFGLTMWYIVTVDKSFLVSSFPHNDSVIKNLSYKPLMKGEKIKGEITSVENGLGIISIRFKSSKRIPYKDEDTLVFKLKQKGSNNWYYENTYRSGLIYDVPFLPFGFPIIPDSKGKTYQFELESLYGNTKNGVSLDARSPIIVSKYKHNKEQVLSNPSSLFKFLITKFLNSIQIVDVYFSSIVFLLPFIIYVLWSMGEIKFKNDEGLFFYINKLFSFIDTLFSTYPFIAITIPLVLIGIDIFFLQVLNDLLYIVMAVLWIMLFKKYKAYSIYTVSLSILLLIVAAALLEFDNILAAEKAGTWSFTFLVALFFQILIHEKVRKIY